MNTGSFSAFRFSSVLVSDASLVSAPSVTSTMPATGNPASSSRTPSSAAPILVCEPPNVRSLTEFTRAAVEEKRNVRTRKRSDSDFSSGLVLAAELLPEELGARLVVVPVADLHAARVVDEYGDDVLLRDGGLDDQRGPEQTEDDERQRGHAKHGQDDAVARRARSRGRVR